MNAAYLSDDKDNLRGEPEPDGDLDGGVEGVTHAGSEGLRWCLVGRRRSMRMWRKSGGDDGGDGSRRRKVKRFRTRLRGGESGQ